MATKKKVTTRKKGKAPTTPCPFCGKANHPRKGVCEHCGKALPKKATATNKAKPSTEKLLAFVEAVQTADSLTVAAEKLGQSELAIAKQIDELRGQGYPVKTFPLSERLQVLALLARLSGKSVEQIEAEGAKLATTTTATQTDEAATNGEA